MPLLRDQALYCRDALRSARAAAQRDAERFTDVIVAIEALGQLLSGRRMTLANYKRHIQPLIEPGPLARATAAVATRLQLPWSDLYDVVRIARNSVHHEGAYARHLTSRSIELALIIEDAIMATMNHVGDYMVREVVTVRLWQPISFVRQVMLANSFSCVPVEVGDGASGEWRVVSDHALASFLRTADSPGERNDRLSQRLETAIQGGELSLDRPFLCRGDCLVADALGQCNGLPILIVGPNQHDLVGIATPFDLL